MRTYRPSKTSIPYWRWEEAFDKFGFNDGDGIVMTEVVANRLRCAGYVVRTTVWGCHNTIIDRIERDGRSIIPDTANVGYDHPGHYLPEEVVRLLDSLHDEPQACAPDNGRRVQWADLVLLNFCRDSGGHIDDALPDLLADLMHWCRNEGRDFEQALDRARMHFEAEVQP